MTNSNKQANRHKTSQISNSKTNYCLASEQLKTKIHNTGIMSLIAGFTLSAPAFIMLAMTHNMSSDTSFGYSTVAAIYILLFELPLGVIFGIVIIIRLIYLRLKFGAIIYSRDFIFVIIGVILCLWPALKILIAIFPSIVP